MDRLCQTWQDFAIANSAPALLSLWTANCLWVWWADSKKCQARGRIFIKYWQRNVKGKHQLVYSCSFLDYGNVMDHLTIQHCLLSQCWCSLLCCGGCKFQLSNGTFRTLKDGEWIALADNSVRSSDDNSLEARIHFSISGIVGRYRPQLMCGTIAHRRSCHKGGVTSIVSCHTVARSSGACPVSRLEVVSHIAWIDANLSIVGQGIVKNPIDIVRHVNDVSNSEFVVLHGDTWSTSGHLAGGRRFTGRWRGWQQ